MSQNNNGDVDYLTIDSAVGSLRGFVRRDYPHVAQFLGIPFAEAPIGPLRFRPPVPRKKLDDDIDATQFGPSCPQWFGDVPSVYNTDCPEYRITDKTDEDCLSLCVWTPLEAAKDPQKHKLPVIVWLTGGAYLVGGNSIPYQNPTPWIEHSQRHIVVSINYRLSIFGFPNARGLARHEQNVAFLDQRLGLEWVHANIAAFGGDPDRLTHFGQSAGACCVDRASFADVDRPLVRGLILHSGVALMALPNPDVDQVSFSFVAKKLGFLGDDPQEELVFMQKQEPYTMLKTMAEHYYSKQPPSLCFRPTIDEHTLFSDLEQRLKDGKVAKLPSIIGTTSDEGNSLVEYNPEGIDQAKADGITKNFFLAPAVQTARLRAPLAPVFRFLLKDNAPPGSSSFPNIAPRPWQRAYHSSDMPLVFGTHDWARGPSTEYEVTVSRAWQDLLVKFAEDGPEGLKKAGWDEVANRKGIVVGVGDKGWQSVPLEEIDV